MPQIMKIIKNINIDLTKKKESEIPYGSKREEKTVPSYPPHLTIVICWNNTAFLFPVYGE
jgi:hypothetical protein